MKSPLRRPRQLLLVIASGLMSGAMLLTYSGHRPRPSNLTFQPNPSTWSGQTKAQISETYGRLPLSFEANQGQTDARARFLARGSGYSLFLTPTEAVLTLRKDERGRRKAELKPPSSSFSA